MSLTYGYRRALLMSGLTVPQQILGSSLLGYWDATAVGNITLSGSSVTSWRDIVGGYNVTQAVGSARPVWGATSFNGQPGITFDGSDDELSLGTSPFPINTDPCEIWVLSNQAALLADVGARKSFAYGSAPATCRAAFRGNGPGIVRAYGSVGNGVTEVANANNTVDYQGIHVVRAVITGTTQALQIDDNITAFFASIAATDSTRLRIGASSNATPTLFWQGTHAAALVTSLLTAPQAARLTAYLKARGGIP